MKFIKKHQNTLTFISILYITFFPIFLHLVVEISKMGEYFWGNMSLFMLFYSIPSGIILILIFALLRYLSTKQKGSRIQKVANFLYRLLQIWITMLIIMSIFQIIEIITYFDNNIEKNYPWFEQEIQEVLNR